MIRFIKPINEHRLRMAYNNDVIRFTGSSVTIPEYCELILHGIAGLAEDIKVILYPNPAGQFYFNFRPYVSALINTRNFDDTLTTNVTALPASFTYNVAQGVFLQKTVTISLRNSSGNEISSNRFVLDWLAGAEQITDYNTFYKSDYFIMSPFKKLSRNQYYIKYWQGYPFDISVYTNQPRIYLYNTTNLLDAVFPVPLPPPNTPSFNMAATPGPVCRLLFSDGRTDETIEDHFPLIEGINTVRFKANAYNDQNDKFITIEKVPYACGVYLKWLNKYGGYSYWLFENTYAIDRTTKQLGELDRDNLNLEDSFGRSIQIGKESQDSLKILAELLTEDERTHVEGLLDSPKIYLFTGQPFARNSYRDWAEVTLKTTSARIKNFRQPLTNFSFDIELPQRYTQTL